MQNDLQHLFVVKLKIRLKDLKDIYLNRQLNDVIIDAFLALLEVSMIYIIYIHKI